MTRSTDAAVDPDGKAAGHEFFDGPIPRLMALDEFTNESEQPSGQSVVHEFLEEKEPLAAVPFLNAEDFINASASFPESLSPEHSVSDPEMAASAIDQNGLAGMLNAGASSVASKLPWFSKPDWKMFAGRDHGQDSYHFGDVTRGVVQQAMPSIRERIHKTKAMALDAKEQFTEKRHQLLHQVVSNMPELEGASPSNVQSTNTSAMEAKRWWAEACAAAHVPHSFEADSASLPERPCHSEGEPARGCLEVEVLSFSSSPPISRPDGGVALGPVCQLALGSRCTGALRPRDTSAAASNGSLPSSEISGIGAADALGLGARQSSSSGSEPAEIGEVVSVAASTAASDVATATSSGDAAAVGTSCGSKCDLTAHTARFAVDEVLGSDLRVHVFDSKQSSFNIGMEDHAFCGGAFVPLSSLLRRGAQSSLYSQDQGFCCRVLTDEIKVALLPLEAVRMAKKLKSVETVSAGLERPTVDMGHILLRLQLTLYDMVPAQLYFALPFRGECLEAMTDLGSIDDPMSVLKAVAAGVQRVRRALDTELWLKAFDQLREAALSSLLLLSLWTYAMLLAPVWKLPGLFASALAMVVWQLSSQAQIARADDPPRLYKDELADSGLTYMERVKKGAAQAMKVELGLMQFARGLHRVATRAEKILYLVTLRDPYLSMIVGGIIIGSMLMVTLCLGVFMAIFGRRGPPVLLWACGLAILLPSNCRAFLYILFDWVQDQKVRYFGQGKLTQMMESFWLRIPDGPEAIHCDLFERYLLVK